MGDWVISTKECGAVKIAKDGYNSKYCIYIGFVGCGGEYARITNVAYTSDAILTVFYIKSKVNEYGMGPGYFVVGHTGYGEVKTTKLFKRWTKLRAVFYYNDNIGYAVGSLEEYDQNTGSWTPVVTSIFRKKTEPVAGNLYFESRMKGSATYLGVTDVYLDNIELYTSKSLFVSKVVSEAIENIISKS